MQKVEDIFFSLYWGCIIPNRYPSVEKATRTVLNALNINTIEMKDVTCCPAPGVFKSVDKVLWLALAARNIAIAEKSNTDILTFCNLCYSTLIEVEQKLRTEPELKDRINSVLQSINYIYQGKSRIRHISDFLYYDLGLNFIRSIVKRKLGLKVAIHYGCSLLKPSDLRPFGGECEKPTFLDEIVEVLGCKSLDYKLKMQCCGAGGGVRTSMKKVSMDFLLDKLRQIRAVGADCIVVVCPFCQLQFDLGQLEIKDLLPKDEKPYQIPVFYLTQLIGLAMGIDFNELGLIKPKLLTGISPFIEYNQILDKIAKIPFDITEKKVNEKIID